MRRVAALLAAVLCGLALTGCGDGAEPGAPDGATLVLDFQPNAVHAGLYAADARGYFEDSGLDLEITEPSSTADGAKLLEGGRADFAILDINDFGIARERGLDIVAIAAIVQRPLASVIAGDQGEIRSPADLAGKTVGVTGVPSDDAVLDTVLTSAALPPDAVDRKTIGFESVRLLASGKVDAATAFWNAEGVTLQEEGIPTREFRVDQFGALRYPELVIAADADPPKSRNVVACNFVIALQRGYEVLANDPDSALAALLESAPELDESVQSAQLDALLAANAFTPRVDPLGSRTPEVTAQIDFRQGAGPWVRWAAENGIARVDSPLKAFPYEYCFELGEAES